MEMAAELSQVVGIGGRRPHLRQGAPERAIARVAVCRPRRRARDMAQEYRERHLGFLQIWIKQEYDLGGWPQLCERLRSAYGRLIAAGRTPLIIDAGANIGLASLWFATMFPEARIYAVEPDEGNLALLRRNVASCRNVVVLPGAVWDRPCEVGIANPDAGAGGFRVAEGGGDVRAYTIPEIVKAAGDEPFIVKIDIEGGEDALFRSNTDWLSAAHLTILELHDWMLPSQGTSRNFLRCISETSVDVVFQGENVFCFKYG
jgi:FkbM family methyltransferase